MIKVDSKMLGPSMFVQDAPDDPRNVLVRPEVRAMYAMHHATKDIDLRCIETYAPGHALVERTNSMFILRLVSAAWQGAAVEAFLCSHRLFQGKAQPLIAIVHLFNRCSVFLIVLFGNDLYPSEGCFYEKLPMLAQHRLYKDFPEPEDCSYVMSTGIWVMRRLPHSSRSHYRSVLVFSTPVNSQAAWTSPFLSAFTDMFHRAIDRVLNGPSFRDLRSIDAEMYLVLSIRSYNRGHPMVPHSEGSDSFTVSRGERVGLVSWARFKPGEKFCMSEYLHCFVKELGYELKTYDTLDGRKLVPYQCVVVRHEWDQLRAAFFEAFKVAKAAYRHANGGTSTPSLSEDAHPHFALHNSTDFAQPEAIKTVVRNTFLELDEGSIAATDCHLKRSTSTGEVMTFSV
eukprot:Skav206202  [mRNA]  locus=scaffold1844:369914:371377:- [translate_table: standard]